MQFLHHFKDIFHFYHSVVLFLFLNLVFLVYLSSTYINCSQLKYLNLSPKFFIVDEQLTLQDIRHSVASRIESDGISGHWHIWSRLNPRTNQVKHIRSEEHT